MILSSLILLLNMAFADIGSYEVKFVNSKISRLEFSKALEKEAKASRNLFLALKAKLILEVKDEEIYEVEAMKQCDSFDSNCLPRVDVIRILARKLFLTSKDPKYSILESKAKFILDGSRDYKIKEYVHKSSDPKGLKQKIDDLESLYSGKEGDKMPESLKKEIEKLKETLKDN